MSIEWHVVCDKTRQSFELGKGNWSLLRSKLPFSCIEDMSEALLSIWKDMYAEQSPETHEYIREIGQRLFKFCESVKWDVEILCDDYYMDRYFDIKKSTEQWSIKQVDSRYENGFREETK